MVKIITKRFKSKKKSSQSNKMAKKKGSKSKSSSGRSSGVFSGKVLGFKIPVVGGVLKNKTFQKAAAGVGVVSIALSVAALINNPTINSILSRREARLALAAAGGDVIGLGAEFVREGGLNLGGNQQQATIGGVGAA